MLLIEGQDAYSEYLKLKDGDKVLNESGMVISVTGDPRLEIIDGEELITIPIMEIQLDEDECPDCGHQGLKIVSIAITKEMHP